MDQNKVTLRKIDFGNLYQILDLDVDESQKNFVTTSAVSVAEAYVCKEAGGWAAPLGIYVGETPVGFVLLTYGKWFSHEIGMLCENVYEVDHYYIDKRFQGKGYGKAGLSAVLDYIRTFPAGPAPLVWLGYKPCNNAAKSLYHSFGFTDTAYMNYDETVAVLKLD